MVIFIGTLLGIGVGCAFGVIISRLIINKRMIELEDEKLRILEKQLSVVAEKCDRTQKACRILSDIVKDNYRTEEKEERETSKTPQSESEEKINAHNLWDEINRCEIENMMNSIHPVLYPQTCGELYASSLYPQTCSILNRQECSIEDSVLRNMTLMQNCSISEEEAQKRLFHALYPGWRLPDDPD